MSNEEYERMMEFILGQQAQFSANIQEHNERFARNEELANRISEQVGLLGERVGLLGEHVGLIGERMIQLEDVVNRLAAVTLTGFKDVNAKIDALVDSHIRLSDAQARAEVTQNQVSAWLARLAEAQARAEANQARTDEALKNLIGSLERYINERRSGGQK